MAIKQQHLVTAWLALAASLCNPSMCAAPLVDATAHRNFADQLTSILYTNDNECTSALGVSMAFSLIYPGSTGDAKDEIRNTLGYPSGTKNNVLVWKNTTQDMLIASDGQCLDGWGDECYSHAPLVKIANSIWFDDGRKLHPDYEEVVVSYAKQIDFEADNSPILVNEWVNNSTNGLIESIVPDDMPLSPYVLIAINSIYLKASWAEQFTKSKTNLDSFYSSILRDTVASKAHFMNAVFDSLPYSHDALPDYQIVQLPFASSEMSMVFVLPLSDSAGPVTTSDLIPALDDLQSTRVALSIPKFKFESKYDGNLKDAVMQAGIVAPFSGGALCGLFENQDGCEALVVNKIIQKTVIDVNEEGVEAAAVTAIFVDESEPMYTSEPILMVLDYPFQFFIYDKTQDLVLFEGRLGSPEVSQSEHGIQLLDAIHSDEDFWTKVFNANVSPIKILAKTTATGSTSVPDGGSATTIKPSSIPPADIADTGHPPRQPNDHPTKPSEPHTISSGVSKAKSEALFFMLCFGVCLVEMGANIWLVIGFTIALGYML